MTLLVNNAIKDGHRKVIIDLFRLKREYLKMAFVVSYVIRCFMKLSVSISCQFTSVLSQM